MHRAAKTLRHTMDQTTRSWTPFAPKPLVFSPRRVSETRGLLSRARTINCALDRKSLKSRTRSKVSEPMLLWPIAAFRRLWTSFRCASPLFFEREIKGAFGPALAPARVASASSRDSARLCRSFPRQCHRLSCASVDSQVSAEPRHHRTICTVGLRAPEPSSPASPLWEPCGRFRHARYSSAADPCVSRYRLVTASFLRATLANGRKSPCSLSL